MRFFIVKQGKISTVRECVDLQVFGMRIVGLRLLDTISWSTISTPVGSFSTKFGEMMVERLENEVCRIWGMCKVEFCRISLVSGGKAR